MRLKENFNIRKIGDQYMMVLKSHLEVNYSRVISMNEAAKYLLETVKDREFTVDDMALLLVEKYGINSETAASDAQALVDKLVAAGMVEE